MAIDTAERRNSALLDPWGVLPFPDGTIGSGDRLTLLGFYSGIAATEPTGELPTQQTGRGRVSAPLAGGRYAAPRAGGRFSVPLGRGKHR